MKTIYVSITSLDDSELIPTVLGAFSNASNPERVFVGVHLYSDISLRDSFIEKVSKYSKNIRFNFTEILEENFVEMSGVGKGRKRAIQLYNNEDYMLQIDSHSLFASKWDDTLIDTLEEAKKFVKNEKTIITAYSGYYKFNALGKRVWCKHDLDGEGYTGNFLLPRYVSDERYYGTIPVWTIFTEKEMRNFPGKFIPATKFNANFAFGDSEWAKNTGLYENAEFYEEEVLQTLNLIKLGYTLVFPRIEEPVIGHLYSDFISGSYGERKPIGTYSWAGEGLSEVTGSGVAGSKNYESYISDPENLAAVKEYSKYARIHMRFGPLDAKPQAPRYFLNSEVRYEY